MAVRSITEELVVKLLWEAKIAPVSVISQKFIDFANLVAAYEREECAKICDRQAMEAECPERAEYCADEIRKRV